MPKRLPTIEATVVGLIILKIGIGKPDIIPGGLLVPQGKLLNSLCPCHFKGSSSFLNSHEEYTRVHLLLASILKIFLHFGREGRWSWSGGYILFHLGKTSFEFVFIPILSRRNCGGYVRERR